MSEFSAIRALAKERYDRLVAKATGEYESTLARINEFESDLTGRVRQRQTICASIESAIPADKEFSIEDIMATLQAMDDSRAWSKPKVWNHIAKLRRKGLTRRTKLHSYNEPAMYVRSDVETPERPFANMSLNEVVQQVLADKQMTELELTVAVLEAGYESKRTRRELREAIRQTLKKDERYMKDGEKWSALNH